MIRTKEGRPLLTFPSHIIGPQFVAAITVFVLFTVELQHLGSLIKILLDPFQIVHQSIAACEERAKSFKSGGVGRVQVWQAGCAFYLGQASVLLLVAQRLRRLPAMREIWVRSLGREDPLEKEMATHSSILVWKIPWTEKPGGLSLTQIRYNVAGSRRGRKKRKRQGPIRGPYIR